MKLKTNKYDALQCNYVIGIQTTTKICPQRLEVFDKHCLHADWNSSCQGQWVTRLIHQETKTEPSDTNVWSWRRAFGVACLSPQQTPTITYTTTHTASHYSCRPLLCRIEWQGQKTVPVISKSSDCVVSVSTIVLPTWQLKLSNCCHRCQVASSTHQFQTA